MKVPQKRSSPTASFGIPGPGANVTNAESTWSANAATTSLPYPILSAMTPPIMMPKQKPVKPAPLMLPNSVAVKPNSAPQLSRIPPRIAKPTPAARMAIKPAQRSRFALVGVMLSFLLFMDLGHSLHLKVPASRVIVSALWAPTGVLIFSFHGDCQNDCKPRLGGQLEEAA